MKKIIHNIEYVLQLRNAGIWRAKGLYTKIKKGHARLRDLDEMAQAARCSLVFLTSGGKYDYHGTLDTLQAITASIRHHRLNQHDLARMMGNKDAYAINRDIRNRTISVNKLLRMADILNIELFEMLCDGEYTPAPMEIPGRQAPRDVIIRDLCLMGWL